MEPYLLDRVQEGLETGSDFDGFGWGDIWPDDAWVRVTQAGAEQILRCRNWLAQAPALPGAIPQLRYNLQGSELVDAQFIHAPGTPDWTQVEVDKTLVIELHGFQVVGKNHNGAEVKTDLIPFDHFQQIEKIVANESPAQAMALVEQLSRMTMDGEMSDGQPFIMGADDAVSTLNRLIEEARGIEEGRQSQLDAAGSKPRMKP